MKFKSGNVLRPKIKNGYGYLIIQISGDSVEYLIMENKSYFSNRLMSRDVDFLNPGYKRFKRV